VGIFLEMEPGPVLVWEPRSSGGAVALSLLLSFETSVAVTVSMDTFDNSIQSMDCRF
jgi:hypothetical protein